MSLHFNIGLAGDTLIVNASGFDGIRAEVEENGLAVIDACVRHGVTRVLCDESRMEYRLDTFDTYRAAEAIAARAQSVSGAAIVTWRRALTTRAFGRRSS